MIEILTRKEFINAIIKKWNTDKNFLPILFSYEEYVGRKSQWFVCIEASAIVDGGKSEYWDWCNEFLSGKLICYSSGSPGEDEWWGFTEKNDILLWSLKWLGKN